MGGFQKTRKAQTARRLVGQPKPRWLVSHAHTRARAQAATATNEKRKKKKNRKIFFFFFLKFCGEGAAQRARGEGGVCGNVGAGSGWTDSNNGWSGGGNDSTFRFGLGFTGRPRGHAERSLARSRRAGSVVVLVVVVQASDRHQLGAGLRARVGQTRSIRKRSSLRLGWLWSTRVCGTGRSTRSRRRSARANLHRQHKRRSNRTAARETRLQRTFAATLKRSRAAATLDLADTRRPIAAKRATNRQHGDKRRTTGERVQQATSAHSVTPSRPRSVAFDGRQRRQVRTSFPHRRGDGAGTEEPNSHFDLDGVFVIAKRT